MKKKNQKRPQTRTDLRATELTETKKNAPRPYHVQSISTIHLREDSPTQNCARLWLRALNLTSPLLFITVRVEKLRVSSRWSSQCCLLHKLTLARCGLGHRQNKGRVKNRCKPRDCKVFRQKISQGEQTATFSVCSSHKINTTSKTFVVYIRFPITAPLFIYSNNQTFQKVQFKMQLQTKTVPGARILAVLPYKLYISFKYEQLFIR